MPTSACGRIRSGTVLLCTWLAVMAVLCAPGLERGLLAQPEAGSLVARDLELPVVPWLVLPAQWEGHAAVMAFSRGEAPIPGAAGGPALFLLSARSGVLQTVAVWPLPGNSRWLEPLTLAGGETAWLLLAGQNLEMGRLRNGSLTWQRLCSCASIYETADPEQLGTRLARDLDGDGADEVLLPTLRGLTVYRTLRWGRKDLAPVALEPVVQMLWEADGKPLQRAPDAAQPRVPELTPGLARGVAQLLRTTQDGFIAMHLPPRAALNTAIVLNPATRATAQAAGLAPHMLAALAGILDGTFRDGAALADALARGDADGTLAADLPALIVALKGGWPETAPEHVALAGLDAAGPDRGYLLALEDVTGDGIPDLVFGLVRNQSQILRAASELRFYPGTDPASLAFGTPQVLKFSGPAVATVLRTGARERVVLVARTDVTLGALLRALSTHEATLETAIYGLGAGGLGTVPVRSAALTFRDFQEGSQVLLLAANLEGTGRQDVLLNLRPDAVSLFASDASGPDLAHAAATLTGPLPREREEVLAGDWQGNGRDTLVFWYRGRKLPHQQRRTLRLVSWEPAH